jgi:hypothetical protein
MRSKLLLLSVLLLAVPALCQVQQPVVRLSSGAPTGSCAPTQIDIDSTTGNLYTCNAGSWSLFSSTATVAATTNVLKGDGAGNASPANVIASGTTSGHYLRNNGTNFVDAAIQAADVPTLNQNTSGTAANLSGTPAVPNGTTATTQANSDSSTKLATTAFVNTRVAPAMNTADMTAQSSGTCTNITGLTWSIAASKNYILTCEIPVTFAASATLQFCLNGPGSPTHYTLNVAGAMGTSAGFFDSTTADTSWGTKTAATAAPGAVTEVAHVRAEIQNGSTASGTALTLQTAADGTHNITVLGDAACTLTQVN